MTRKSTRDQQGPVLKQFSSREEIDRGIGRIRRRIEQVRALDPSKIEFNDAAVNVAESDIHATILEVFGPSSPEAREFGHIQIWKGPMSINMPKHVIQARFAEGIPHVAAQLEALVKRLEEKRDDLSTSEPAAPPAAAPRRVFIGHGRSSAWLTLDDLLRNRIKIDTDEFNRESPAGLSHKERLTQMLNRTSFAFLVMTAEDEHADGSHHARENVIHEIGLFQGRHGFERAIVLLEEGCVEFSNINGLNQIRFPKGDLLARSEQVRQVLEREGMLP